MKEFSCSNHLIERSAERYGYDAETARKVAERAIRNGKTVEDYSGKARRYLEDIQNRYDPEHIMLRVHSNNCYILSDTGIVITVYPLGQAFLRLNRPKAPRFSDGDISAIADLLIPILFCCHKKRLRLIMVHFIIYEKNGGSYYGTELFWQGV